MKEKNIDLTKFDQLGKNIKEVLSASRVDENQKFEIKEARIDNIISKKLQEKGFYKLSKKYAESAKKVSKKYKVDLNDSSEVRAKELLLKTNNSKSESKLPWMISFATIGLSVVLLISYAVFFTDMFNAPKSLGLLSELANTQPTPLITLKPDNITKNGYASQQNQFNMVLKEPIISDINTSLKVEPNISYDIVSAQNNDETVYTIIPKQELEKGQEYKVILQEGTKFEDGSQLLKDLTWVIAVEPNFNIISTLPADEAILVPNDTSIELEFNHQDFSVENLMDYFSITPSVNGHFEKYGSRAVFLLDTKLTADTIYSVVVDDQFTNNSGEKLEHSMSFSFKTIESYSDDESEIYDVSFEDASAQYINYVTTSEDIAQFVGIQGKGQYQIQFDLYKLNNQDGKEYILQNRGFLGDVPQNAQLVESRTEQFQSPNESYSYYDDTYTYRYDLNENGVYFLKATHLTNGISRIQGIIRSQLSLVVLDNADKLEGWALDLANEQGVTGVKVQGYTIDKVDSESATTGEGGYFSIENTDLYFAEHNGSMAFMNASFVQRMTYMFGTDLHTSFIIENRSPYTASIFTDKPIYYPGDTINYKAMVRESFGDDVIIPEGVKATVTIYSMSTYASGMDTIFYQQEMPINQWGEIIGSYALPTSAQTDMLMIYIVIDGSWITYKQIYTGEYIKPTYQLKVTADKEKVFAGESVSLLIEGIDYSNRPMSNMDVKLSIAAQDIKEGYDSSRQYYRSFENKKFETTVKLDQNGRAVYTYTPQIPGGEVNYKSYTAFLNLPEHNDAITESDVFIVSAGKTGMRSNNQLKADNQGLSVGDSVNVTIESVSHWNDTLLPNQEFTASVKRSWYERVYIGNHYDSYRKKVVDDYVSEYHEEIYLPETNYITNGEGYYTIPFENLPEGSYEITIKWNGHYIVRNLYVADYRDYNGDTSYLMKVTASQKEANPGEQLVATVTTKGSYNMILSVSGRDLDSWTQFRTDSGESNTNIDFVMPDKSFPRATVCAIGIFPPDSVSRNRQGNLVEGTKSLGWDCVSVDNTSQEGLMQIDTSTDKEKYSPGEKVTLNVDAKRLDKQTQKSSLLIALVDQSLLDLTYTKDYEGEYLRDSIYDAIVGNSYISTNELFATYTSAGGGMGGAGGAGAGRLREDFKDVAAWLTTVETDNNGHAKVDITLPDNLTTWNILVVSSDKDGGFGIQNSSIYTTLPASVDYDIPDMLRTKDRFALEGRVTNLEDAFEGKVIFKCEGCVEDEANAQFNIEKSDVEEVRTTFAVAPGSNTVVIETSIYKCSEGNCDQFIDGVRKSIPVLNSGFVTNDNMSTTFNSQQESIEHTVTLKNDFRQDVTSGNITISKAFPLIFSSCVYLSSNMSTDSLSAEILKNVFMAKNYDTLQPANVYKEDLDNIISKGVSNLMSNQNSDGGFGYYMYDSSSIEATLAAIRALSVASEYLPNSSFTSESRRNAITYLNQIMVSDDYSIEHKIYSNNAIAYLDPILAQSYVSILQSEFEKKEEYITDPSLTVSLMDTNNRLGSTGSVNELSVYLENTAKVEGNQMYWEAPDSLLISMRDPRVMTAYAYNAISPLELWETKSKTKNWLLDKSNNYLSCDYRSMMTEYALANSDFTNIFDRSYEASFDIMLNGEYLSTVKVKGEDYWGYQNVFIDGSKFKSGENQITINRKGEGDVYIISDVMKEAEDNNVQITGDEAVLMTKTMYDDSTGAVLQAGQPIPENTIVRVEISVESTKDLSRVVLHDAIPGGFRSVYDIISLGAGAKQYYTNTENTENVIYNNYGYDGKDYFSFYQYSIKPGYKYIFSYLAVADLEGRYDGGKSTLYQDNQTNLLKTLTNGTIIIE